MSEAPKLRSIVGETSQDVFDMLDMATALAHGSHVRGVIIITVEAGEDADTIVRFAGLNHLERVGCLATAFHSAASDAEAEQ